MNLIGIDTGGTFTDFVHFDGVRVRIHKELSTPDAPERAVLRGIAALGVDLAGTRVIHGSTVATNAVLERKGVRTVFITNHGLADLLTIGRQARPELYNLKPQAAPPPVPRSCCLETGGRLSATGEVVEPLAATDIATLAAEVRRRQPAAVAITLLFSFIDDRFERAVAEAMPAGVFVSCSSQVLPEIREYERGIATWLNAYIGPIMQGYLSGLAAGLRGARLSVMQSSAVTCEPGFAGRRAVNLLLSGPAGGLLGARHVGALANAGRLITFDMGGTSTDVALVDGEIALTSEGVIGSYPVGVPMVDLHTIGAGGGSIAHVDAGGMLRVGPLSAGATPGPACYVRGGCEPTVTDANVVLGRIPAVARLGGTLVLDVGAARAALEPLTAKLRFTTLEETAAGIVRVANERMQQALRVISVERGVDPRGSTLVSFGGAGGLHVCALAAALGMRRALVPAQAGVLSALGMLIAPPGRQMSKTVRRRLDDLTDTGVASLFAEIGAAGYQELAAEGFDPAVLERRPSADLRYVGQSFTINVPWESRAQAQAEFHAAHERRYGHRFEAPVELVNVRLGLRLCAAQVALPEQRPAGTARPVGSSRVWAIDEAVPVWERSTLAVGTIVRGAAVVIDAAGTSYVEPGWEARVDARGNLALERR